MKQQTYKSKAQQVKMHQLMQAGKIKPEVIQKMDKAVEKKVLPIRIIPKGRPINVRSIAKKKLPTKLSL